MILTILIWIFFYVTNCSELNFPYNVQFWIIPEQNFDHEVFFHLELDTYRLINEYHVFDDCSNIKFEDNEGNILPIWIEHSCGETDTSIWIRFEFGISIEGVYGRFFFGSLTNDDTRYKQRWYEPPLKPFYLNELDHCPDFLTQNGPEEYEGFFMVGYSDDPPSTDWSETHTHEVSGKTNVPTNIMEEEHTEPCGQYEYNCETTEPVKFEHSHTFSLTSEESDSTPPYIGYSLCQSTTGTMDIPPRSLIIFDSSTYSDPPEDIQIVSELSQKFPRIVHPSQSGESGGIDQHSHLENSVDVDVTQETTLGREKSGWALDYLCSSNQHTHTMVGSVSQSPESSYGSNVPVHMQVMFYKNTRLSSTHPPQKGTVIFSLEDLAPPPGWERADDTLNVGQYLRGCGSNDVFGDTGGSDTHKHEYFSVGSIGNSQGGEVECALHDFWDDYYGAGNEHTHTSLTQTTVLEANNGIPFKMFHFYIKQDLSVSAPPVNISMDFANFIYSPWECFGKFMEAEDACNGHGRCSTDDTCICEESWYGDECQEEVYEAKYIYSLFHESMFVIEVNYTVDVVLLEEAKWGRGHMIEHFPCELMLVPGQEEYLWESGEENCDHEDDDDRRKRRDNDDGHGCCTWMTKNLKYTNFLVIEGVQVNNVDSIELMMISDISETLVVNVTQHVFPDDDDDEEEDILHPYLESGYVNPTALIIAAVLICCTIQCCCCCCYCIIICCCCTCCTFLLQKRRMRKYEKLKDLDLIVIEQELDNRSSTEYKKIFASLRINKKLFLVKPNQIKLIEIIGTGGSGSQVYKAKWKSDIVAFKCFTGDICETQGIWMGFEKEVELMSSLSHPNILRFFGSCLVPPRIGIVMEYAPHKDLRTFFAVSEIGKKLHVSERVRLLLEVGSAMFYLHGSHVMHRDLKSMNVVVTKNIVSKVMDFGLSRYIINISTTKTKRIGTLLYMPPEITMGLDYDYSADVFSFGILGFEVLTLNFLPYQSQRADVGLGVEFAVASDPSFRPNWNDERNQEDSFDEILPFSLKKFISRCWDGNPDLRPSFEVIVREFESVLKDMKKKMSQKIKIEQQQQQQQEEEEEEEEEVENRVVEAEILTMDNDVEEEVSDGEQGGFDQISLI